jgi:hypothetical protein
MFRIRSMHHLSKGEPEGQGQMSESGSETVSGAIQRRSLSSSWRQKPMSDLPQRALD